MEKQKENLFREKFSLLNSQEHSEEINWSSNGSSDYEDTSFNDRSNNQVHRTRILKRKRKKKVPKNKSNLSFTIFDACRDSNKVILEATSPILDHTIRQRSTSPSPILKPSRSLYKANTLTSPILTSKNMKSKSPILISKTAFPKSAVKVRKKLFNIGNFNENGVNCKNQSIHLKEEILSDIFIKKEPEDEENETIIGQSGKFGEIKDNLTLNVNTTNAKVEFVKKVKSFFDSHFSSQSTSQMSQNSISDISTPKSSSKTSEEIEIFTCKSQILQNTINSSAEVKQEISANSSENSVYDFDTNSKKIRYKKDGPAYRLNKLLKKQKASLSLWQHERFLAANSNFVIPKGEFTVFRIQKLNFKYGCHLLECVDANDEKFIILINSCYILVNIVCEMVLKLYEPYKIVQYSKCKLIINVTKFECSNISS